ncbi:MAG: ABC transporter permease [Treponema sp.]|nr:ABC transporter permease [Treponema sp.]
MLRKLMKSDATFTMGFVLFIGWIVIAAVANWIAPYDTLAQNLAIRFQPPTGAHWFGTDSIGRDILSRVLVGSRISLFAGLTTIALASTFGLIYGGIAGYVGGIVDDVMMRVSEMVLAFPGIILAMTIAAALGPSLFNSLLAMVVIWWPNYARVMRSMVIANKNEEYVEASRSLGASHLRVFFIEILPHSLGPMLVLATLDFGNAILLFSGLSYLGLGSPPPTPEWGAMVADGALNFNYWWISTFPGLAILTMAVGANFIGDGLRDLLDPKLRKGM